MDASAIKAIMGEIGQVVREYVAAEVAPLAARCAALEDENKALRAKVEEIDGRGVGEAVKEVADKINMAELALDVISEQVGTLMPLVERVSAISDELVGIKAATPEKGEPGEPGRDVDMAEVAERIERAVKAAVDALPAPKPGEPGKDGIGLANALIDREGALVLTMTDGTTKNLGVVHGRDGAPGKDGETFTLDDFDIEALDERTIKLKFTKDEVCHSFELSFPVLIGRGVWSTETEYERGDVVTWGGTAWEAVEPEKGVKPDQSNRGWRILAKRGRDGKDFGK